MNFAITPESLLALLGVVVSLLFSYFPVLRVKFAALQPEAKSGIMIGVLILLTAVVFGMSCASLLSTGLACDQVGAWRVVVALAMALATNQGTWMATKNLPAGDVKRPLLEDQSGKVL